MTIFQRRRLGYALLLALLGSIAIILVSYFLGGGVFNIRAAQASRRAFFVWTLSGGLNLFHISVLISFAPGIRSFYQRRRALLIPVIIALVGGIALSVGSCFVALGNISRSRPQGEIAPEYVGFFAGLIAFALAGIWTVVRGVKSLFEPLPETPQFPRVQRRNHLQP